jgi:hypothetical protein
MATTSSNVPLATPELVPVLVARPIQICLPSTPERETYRAPERAPHHEACRRMTASRERWGSRRYKVELGPNPSLSRTSLPVLPPSLLQHLESSAMQSTSPCTLKPSVFIIVILASSAAAEWRKIDNTKGDVAGPMPVYNGTWYPVTDHANNATFHASNAVNASIQLKFTGEC